MKLALVLIGLVACNKETPTSTRMVRGSCQSSPAVCEQYESTDAKYVKRQQDGCTGTWTALPCPPVGQAGSCREERGWIRTRFYYRGVDNEPNPAVEKAKAECAAYGTWRE